MVRSTTAFIHLIFLLHTRQPQANNLPYSPSVESGFTGICKERNSMSLIPGFGGRDDCPQFKLFKVLLLPLSVIAGDRDKALVLKKS